MLTKNYSFFEGKTSHGVASLILYPVERGFPEIVNNMVPGISSESFITF